MKIALVSHSDDGMKEDIYDIFNSPKMNTNNSICRACLIQ